MSKQLEKLIKVHGIPEKVFDRGTGDFRVIGYEFSNGSRVIETNGDLAYEGENGFEEVWEGKEQQQGGR